MSESKGNEDMQAILASEKANRKDEIQAINKKAVEVKGKALKRLSEN